MGNGNIMDVLKCVEEINNKYICKKTIYTAGNGGSSSTASHFTNDLIKGCAIHGRAGIKSICLTDSSAVLTCLSNDYSYEDALMLYLKTMGTPGDCLAVFSGSGNSENVIRASKYALEAGIIVIGFLGRDGGRLKNYCDHYVLAPSDDMEEIEDLHLSYIHQIKKSLISHLEKSFGMEVITYPKYVTTQAFPFRVSLC